MASAKQASAKQVPTLPSEESRAVLAKSKAKSLSKSQVDFKKTRDFLLGTKNIKRTAEMVKKAMATSKAKSLSKSKGPQGRR